MNTINHAFLKLKSSQINQETVGEDEREIFQNVVGKFVQKINHVLTINTRTKLSLSYGKILLSIDEKSRTT